VLASIYGDISSERGEARLTKISCTRKDGSILEKKVQGYLSFAGKEGIKGTPVTRNGRILAMAGLSGMFSGVGSALKAAAQTQSISALGATTTVNSDQIWQSGAYGGAESAMSQLSSYYIKRADQYHAVIEIGSGTVATVIFQSGFSLKDEEESVGGKKSFRRGASSGSAEESRDLLKKAQASSSIKTKLPFSNVN
jgi:conjugal transfer pilus assembly protein TraB